MLPFVTLQTHTEQNKQHKEWIQSPNLRKRADSLVFSITSQKYDSPKDSMELNSKQNDVNRELETLQLKLQFLQSKVQNITSDPYISHEYRERQNINNQSSILCNTQKNSQNSRNKQNKDINTNKIGKIVKKERELSTTNRIIKSNQIKNKNDTTTITGISHHSLISENSAMFHTKSKELSKLKKQLSVLKNSIEKTERSKSACSERLSASKSLIKKLKNQEKHHQKIIKKLRSDLQKSQTIREKQKQFILKQQQQITYFKQLAINLHRRIR